LALRAKGGVANGRRSEREKTNMQSPLQSRQSILVQSDSFDAMARSFTSKVRSAADWKNHYVGAAYATRIRSAITDLRAAIAEAERHPEIASGQE
jgi:hypothetical protein